MYILENNHFFLNENSDSLTDGEQYFTQSEYSVSTQIKFP